MEKLEIKLGVCSLQILVRLDCFSHIITMVAFTPARRKAAKIHRNEYSPESIKVGFLEMHNVIRVRVPPTRIQKCTARLQDNNRIPQRTGIVEANCCLKVHNAHLKLVSPILA